MPVKFSKHTTDAENYQKIVFTAILISGWICFKMAAILDTIMNMSSLWIKPILHFNFLYY